MVHEAVANLKTGNLSTYLQRFSSCNAIKESTSYFRNYNCNGISQMYVDRYIVKSKLTLCATTLMKQTHFNLREQLSMHAK